MRSWLVFLLVGLPVLVMGQDVTPSLQGSPGMQTWRLLLKTTNSPNGDYMIAHYPPEVKALEGKTVTLSGYIYPKYPGYWQQEFFLSSLPIFACFFCGQGGPETVIEIYLKEEMPYTEDIITIRGTFALYPDGLERLFYGLENAEVVK